MTARTCDTCYHEINAENPDHGYGRVMLGDCDDCRTCQALRDRGEDGASQFGMDPAAMTRAACGHRVPDQQVLHVSRSGGGSYRRAGRSYRTTVCVPCAERLEARLPRPGSGHLTYDRYSIHGLRRALAAYRERTP